MAPLHKVNEVSVGTVGAYSRKSKRVLEKSNFLNVDLAPKTHTRAGVLLKGGLGFLHTRLCESFAGQHYRNNVYNISNICFNFLLFFFSFLD